MYGLKAIILHDSYYRGLRTRIPCEGHTNNTGGNAAGKTSALTLIPVFYGKEPDSLINRSGDKWKFVDYYLPSKQSMVIFEYSRETGTCCVVMYRKNDGSFAYRFIEGNADETLFHENMEPLYTSGLDAITLIRHKLPEQGVKVSKQINQIVDYRAIIQNDTQKRKGRTSFRQETFDFCLGSATSHMKHIEALTSVVLKQDRLLKQFKVMIVDSFLSNQISIGALPYNRKDIALIQDLKSLEAFISHKTKINKAIADYQKLNSVWVSLKRCQQQIEQHIRDWNREFEQYTNTLNTLVSTFEEDEERHRKEYGELSLGIEKVAARLKQNNTNLEDLKTQQKKWDKQDILTKKNELEGIEHYIKTKDREEIHYSTLSSEVRTHQEAHDAEKLRTEKEVQDQKNNELEHKAQTIKAFHQQELEHQKSLGDSKDKQYSAIHTYKAEREVQLNILNATLLKAKVNVKVASQPTQEEQDKLKRLNQERKEKNRAYQQAKALHKTSIVTLEQNKLKRQADEESYRKQKRRCEELRTEQEKLSQQLYPKDNTLLAFLRTSEMDWRDTIGKVINPDLLLHPDLSPHLPLHSDNSLNEQSLKNLYGITLTLDSISRCNEAQSEEVLRQKLDNLKTTIRNAEEGLERREIPLQKLNKTVKENTHAVTTAEHKESESEKHVIQIDAYIEAMQESIKAEGEKRRNTASNALLDAEKSIEAFNQETKLSIEAIEQQFKELREQKENEWLANKDKHNEHIKRIKQQIQTLETDLIKRIEELDHQFIRLLKDEGIDTQTLMAAKKRYDDATEKVNKVEGYKTTVEDYKHWKRTFLSQKPEWEQAFIDLSSKINQLESERTSSKNKHDSRSKTFKQKQQKIKQALATIRDQNEQAKATIAATANALKSAPVHLEPDESNPTSSATLLLKSTQSSLKEESLLKNSIIKAVREIIRILENGHTESQIYQLWQQLHTERVQKSRHTESTPEFDLERIQDIQLLNEQGLSQIQNSLIQAVTAIGSRIARYHETLELLNRKVNSISHILESNINTEHQFPAISDIKVKLISKVAEFDLWVDLQQFKHHWEQWREENTDALPNVDFIKAFNNVLDAMSDSKIDSNLYSLVDLNISLKEKDRLVLIRKDSDLKNASSTGVSLLAIIVIFCGMTRYLCDDHNIRIHWPLDEIGKLSSENSSLLFALMDTHNITLFCAQPDPSPALSKYFTHKNELHREKGVRQYKPRIKRNILNPLLNKEFSEELKEEVTELQNQDGVA